VSDCNPFGQGINMRPCNDVKNTINQIQAFTSIPASTFQRLRQLAYLHFTYEFLGIQRVKLGEFLSSAWIPLGRDNRAHRCCRDQSIRVITFVGCKVKSAGTP